MLKSLLLLLWLLVVLSQANLLGSQFSQQKTDHTVVNFELFDIDGQLQRLSDDRGQWVVVNFWATWCGPCVQEISELNRFYQQNNKNGVVVIGVNFEELTIEQLRQAVAELGINYPVLQIGDVPLVPFEPLKGLPATFVVSPQGYSLKSWLGPVNESKLEKYILPRLVGNTASHGGRTGE